ncbi:MAG: hypothetical protein IJ870_00680 [Alphaproteobacteria bacterium]|nr:hypothetical protein [Alphaproteobacteria bacterium]
MKNVFYILIFLSFTSFSTAKADQSLNMRCQAFVPKPNVTVKAVFEPLKYNYDKVSRTLERLQRQEMNGTLLDGYNINGLTPYKLQTSLTFSVGKKSFRDGVTCFFPVDVDLTLTLQEPVIYIARHLKPGTCMQKITLRHEQTHEQINVEALEYYLPFIKDRFLSAVKKYALTSRPKDDVDMAVVQESLKKKYMDAINPLLEELNKEINNEQSKLDRAEHYDYEQSLCL